MDAFQAIIYGLVQGFTEYLPVSSSAHLLLLPHVLNEVDPGLAFDVFLHVGTLFATVVYFWKDWLQILRNPTGKSKQVHLSWIHLIVATVPAVLVGAGLNGLIKEYTRSLWIVYITLPAFGLLLWWIDKKSPSLKRVEGASVKEALIIGCFQTLALVPGVSRSGITITAARSLGFGKSEAARISFLLSFPVTLGAIVFELRHWDELVASVSGLTPLFVGAGAALLSGAFAIRVMLKWMGKVSYGVFAFYRVVVAIALAFVLGVK